MNVLSRSLVAVTRLLWRFRSLGLMSEALYWWRWLGTKGLQWPRAYEERLNSEQPLVPVVASYAARVASDPVSHPRCWRRAGYGDRLPIAGARNQHHCGRRAPPGVRPAIDASQHYTPVRTTYADAERLDQFIEAGTFDIVHARNSIDHAARPAVAIDQMLKAAKPGGYVLLSHAQNEAINESYVGLHQWNFAERDGSFVVWNQAESFDMTRLLRPIAIVKTQMQGQTVFVEMRKHDSENAQRPIVDETIDASRSLSVGVVGANRST